MDGFCGGLARCARLLSLAMALQAAALPARAETPVDVELVLAVDISGSVDPEEGRLQRQGYIDAIAHPQVVDAITSGPMGRIAVAYLEWSGDGQQYVVVPWKLIDGPDSAQAFSDLLAEAPVGSGRYTSISGAIDFAVPMFERNGFEGLRKVIDVSGDGVNNRGRMVSSARDAAVAAGVVVNGLPIINDRPNPFGTYTPRDLDTYFEREVIGGPGAFVMVAESFQTFGSAILAKLLREIAAAPPAAAPSPLARGGLAAAAP